MRLVLLQPRAGSTTHPSEAAVLQHRVVFLPLLHLVLFVKPVAVTFACAKPVSATLPPLRATKPNTLTRPRTTLSLRPPPRLRLVAHPPLPVVTDACLRFSSPVGLGVRTALRV